MKNILLFPIFQDLRKDRNAKSSTAIAWRTAVAARREALPPPAEPPLPPPLEPPPPRDEALGSGGKRPNLPDIWSVAKARDFLPRVRGCRLWHEQRDNVIRTQYTVDLAPLQGYWKVRGDNAPEIVKKALLWCWAEHTKHTGVECDIDWTATPAPEKVAKRARK